MVTRIPAKAAFGSYQCTRSTIAPSSVVLGLLLFSVNNLNSSTGTSTCAFHAPLLYLETMHERIILPDLIGCIALVLGWSFVRDFCYIDLRI